MRIGEPSRRRPSGRAAQPFGQPEQGLGGIVDRAYILHEGQVLREGSPAEIVMDEDVRRVYLGERFSL